MAAVDTNVLVRLLVEDDAAQTRKSEAFLDSGRPLWISTVVLIETSWFLASVSERSKPQVLAALRGLQDSPDFTLQAAAAVRASVELFAASRADLTECLALELARAEGHLPLATFDRRAAKLPGAVAL
jgi:predicted nucleic-acid-binding protein